MLQNKLSLFDRAHCIVNEKLVVWTKAKIAIVVGALLAAGMTAIIVKNAVDMKEAAIFEPIFKKLDTNTLDKLPPTLILRPTRYPGAGNGAMRLPNGKCVCVDLDLGDIIDEAFDAPRVRVLFQEGTGPLMACDDNNYANNSRAFWSDQKMGYKVVDFLGNQPDNQLDYLVTLPDHQEEALRTEVKRQFGLDVRYEMQQADVLVLQIKDTAKLKAHLTNGGAPRTAVPGDKHTEGRAFTNEPISVMARWLEFWSGKPVVDATGLEDRYDITIEWPAQRRIDWQSRRESICQALEQQCGLTLTPNQEPTKMLVIQRVKN